MNARTRNDLLPNAGYIVVMDNGRLDESSIDNGIEEVGDGEAGNSGRVEGRRRRK